MAAVDAASLRAELDDCRARIEAIERNGGASADTLVPVHARFLPLDIPVAVFLEQRCRRPRATPACRARVVMPTTTGPARPRSGHRRPDDARSEGPRGGVTPRDMIRRLRPGRCLRRRWTDCGYRLEYWKSPLEFFTRSLSLSVSTAVSVAPLEVEQVPLSR